MNDQLGVLGHLGPAGDGVLGRHVVFRLGLLRNVGRIAQVDEVRRAADEPNRAVLDPELAHLPGEVALALVWRVGAGVHGVVKGLVVVVQAILGSTGAIFVPEDGLGNRVQAVTGADLLDDGGHVVLVGVEDGLYQHLEGRAAGLHAVDLFPVDALSAVVRVRVVHALGAIDTGAGCTAGEGAVALGLALSTGDTGGADAAPLLAGWVGAASALFARRRRRRRRRRHGAGVAVPGVVVQDTGCRHGEVEVVHQERLWVAVSGCREGGSRGPVMARRG